jgi:hypothetical protein
LYGAEVHQLSVRNSKKSFALPKEKKSPISFSLTFDSFCWALGWGWAGCVCYKAVDTHSTAKSLKDFVACCPSGGCRHLERLGSRFVKI